MSSNASNNENRDGMVAVDRSDEYRSRDLLTALIFLIPKLLLLLLLLFSPSIGAAFAAAGLGTTGETAEAAVPTAEAVLPTAEAPAEEVAAAVEAAPTETAVPTAVPTPDVPEVMPTVAAPAIEDVDVLAPSDIFLNPAAIAAGWVAEQVAGTAIDPNSPGGFAGLPPHISAMFNTGDDQAAKDDGAMVGLNPNQPQLNVIPLAALVSMYNAAGFNDGPAIFDNLKELLEARPDNVTDIPAPPIFGNAGQGYIASPSFIDFTGGSGIGYVAHIGQEVGPLANDNGFSYVFQGLTTDSSQYVIAVWPLDASFLPNTVGEVTQETLDSAAADGNAYVASMIEAVNAAGDSDFTPSLSSLATVLAGLTIGAGAAEANEAATATEISADPGLTNTVWQWTAFQDTAGENDLTVENPENYTLTLLDSGMYLIQADCNTGGGQFEVDGASIQFFPGPLSMAFCGEESLDSAFLGNLFNVATYVFDEDGNLVLNLWADGGNMVFANGGPADVAMMDDGEGAMDGAAESAPVDVSDPAVAGVVGLTLNWTGSVSSDGSSVAIDNPGNYSITLNPDGTYNIVADCNTGFGTYTVEDGQIIFSLPALTKMLCPEGSQSDAFLALLAQPAAYTLDETGNVLLSFGDGATNASFSPELEMTDAMPLVGSYWAWASYDAPEGEDDITVDQPLNYSLVFRPDGTYFIKADCNHGTGSFIVEGELIQLSPAALTRAFCGEESLDGQFLLLLDQATGWAINDAGELVLTLANGGTMVFTNLGDPTNAADVAEGVAVPQPAADEAAITTFTFNWTGATNADGEAVTVENPQNYSFVLNPDGTFNFTADCNSGFGTFTLGDDGTVSFNPLGQTLAYCGEDSQGDEFVQTLLTITAYQFDESGDIVFTTADGSLVNFANAGEAQVELEPMMEIEPIQGIVWEWFAFIDPEGTDTVMIDFPDQYSFVLFPDGTYHMVADCNVVNGTYTFEAGLLTFNPGATTLAACAPDSLDSQFLGYLFQPLTFAMDPGGSLLLILPDGSGQVAFANGGAPTEGGAATGGETAEASPVGATWSWTSFQDPKQSFNVANPANYLIQFMEDGSLALTLDCNTGTGSYTLDGSSISILLGATTLAACPEGSLGTTFATYLAQAAVWSISNDVLFIDLVADGGTMTFVLVP